MKRFIFRLALLMALVGFMPASTVVVPQYSRAEAGILTKLIKTRIAIAVIRGLQKSPAVRRIETRAATHIARKVEEALLPRARTALRGAYNRASQAASQPPPIKPGAAGGPTAGKPFGKTVKREAFAENTERICVFCRQPGKGTQVDHAIPKSKGGNATLDNAQLACPHCNMSKNNLMRPRSPSPGYTGKFPPDHW